ncbi:IclR family transcriptional regulator [Natronococcus pandeyae]|uniref:IclR family transcriptional regulator n=1 Tax=Natronococcus pandeyae TaxID=2055836 RepID=A0A8J8Q629_9EURY|nr:IclR family transcriptional regulator [Natronococcus pandeyae]TYL37920.1 IclR family transcriptional regulator [Natronococcus pandeyae]
MDDTPRSNRPVTTTESSIRLLEQLKDRPGQTLDELAAGSDLARSTVHRHLLTLEDNDFLFREDGTFYLSLRLLDFGISARTRVPFFDVGRRQVDRLAEETGEKVWLVAKEGDFSIHLYKAFGDSPLRTSARVGQRRYLHQLAVGKAILAYLDADELEAIIDRQGLLEMTEHTITDEDELLEELEATRERGYAFNIEESIEGLNAVGAPIRDEDGTPIGGISISGPANRVKGAYLRNELPDKLLAAIDEIQINLRYS